MTEILKETRSICSVCGEIVPAMYEVRDKEQVFFTRRCPTHGQVDTDLGYHAAFYRQSFAVEKLMLQRYGDGGDTDISQGLSPFPLRKPAGLAIVEVTERCNLTCPMCYAYSSPAERDYSLEEIELRLDQLIAVEGKGISLQISGGAFGTQRPGQNRGDGQAQGIWAFGDGEQWYPAGSRTRFC